MRQPEFWSAAGRFHPVALALTPVSWLYAALHRLRWLTTRPLVLPVPVICVGNLTLGGAGKTPVVIAVLQILRSRGLNAFALSRGYGGTIAGAARVGNEHTAREVGDEPMLIAEHAPTIKSGDRRAGAQLAIAEGAQAIVMDDGFQNPTLAKDFSIVVVDAATGFGNGRVFPAGPLRETRAFGLSRSDALIAMGDGSVAIGGKPVLRARIEASTDTRALAGRRLYAFAGIGRPEKFFATLQRAGADVVESRAFPDHYAFTAADVAGIKARAAALGATAITTEKDFARLAAAERPGILTLPVHAVFDDEAAFGRLIDAALAVHARRTRHDGR